MTITQEATTEVAKALNGNFDPVEVQALLNAFDALGVYPNRATFETYGTVKQSADPGVLANDADLAAVRTWLIDLYYWLINAGIIAEGESGGM